MSQNKELNSDQTEKKEIPINRVLCYLDSQILLRLDVLEKFFTKKLSVPTIALNGRLDQRNFLQQIEQISAKDFFVFFIRIVNIEQINELYGKWRKISAHKAKSLLIILDYSLPSFRNDLDNLPSQRYLEMNQDQNTKIILMGRDKLNAETFNQAIEQIIKN